MILRTGMVWYRVVVYSTSMVHGMGLVWSDLIWPDVEWNGMAWYGMV